MIDLGPGGGVNGGEIVVTGTPEVVAAEPRSATGKYLGPLLERAGVKDVTPKIAPRPRKGRVTEDEFDFEGVN